MGQTLQTLMTGREVDRLWSLPRGRAIKLAKSGELPSIVLPGGEVRFDPEALEQFLRDRTSPPAREEVTAHD